MSELIREQAAQRLANLRVIALLQDLLAIDSNLAADLELAASILMGRCPENPKLLLGQPIGQYHCPWCGCMCVAGITHPPHDDGCLLRLDTPPPPSTLSATLGLYEVLQTAKRSSRYMLDADFHLLVDWVERLDAGLGLPHARDLMRAADRMRDRWSEADPSGKHDLWLNLHTQADRLRTALDPQRMPQLGELERLRIFKQEVMDAMKPGRWRGFSGPDGVTLDEVVQDVGRALTNLMDAEQ